MGTGVASETQRHRERREKGTEQASQRHREGHEKGTRKLLILPARPSLPTADCRLPTADSEN